MEPIQVPSPRLGLAIRMKIVLLSFLLLTSSSIQAQISSTMQVQLEVLPRALSVSVSSSHLDLAQQRADAGTVTMDPATGLANQKTTAPHAMGEVIVEGPAQGTFLVSVDSKVDLRQIGGQHEVIFTPIWAQSSGCGPMAVMINSAGQAATGVLGDDGCATLRFGGKVNLLGATQGRYIGQLAVRIIPQ
ncbi:MAG: hypothetical protein OXF06_02725 [Bacteroidetes bacterium]|nr:hypothetical protein [Bacteroidota bacterium]